MPSPMQQKALAAIRAGKAVDIASLARAIGVHPKAASNVLGTLRRAGLITYEMLHARAIDWSSLRIAGERPVRAAAKAEKRTARASSGGADEAEPSRVLLVDGMRLVRVSVLSRQLAEEIEALSASAQTVPDGVRALIADPSLVDALVSVASAIRAPVTMAAPAPAGRSVRRVSATARTEPARLIETEPDAQFGDAIDDDEPAIGDEPAVEGTRESTSEGTSEESSEETDEIAADSRAILAEDAADARGSDEGAAPAPALEPVKLPTVPPARHFEVRRSPDIAYTLVHVESGRELESFRAETVQRHGRPFDKALVRAIQANAQRPGTVVVNTKTGTEITRPEGMAS